MKARKVLIGTAIAVPFALWIILFSEDERSDTVSQGGVGSEPIQSVKARETVVPSDDPDTNSKAAEDARGATGFRSIIRLDLDW